jgi:hypothetical protein
MNMNEGALQHGAPFPVFLTTSVGEAVQRANAL